METPELSQLQLLELARVNLVGRLVAGLAHDIKNPLATVQMGIDYLCKHASQADETTDAVLDGMGSALRRLHSIIRELVGLASASAGNVDLKDENLNSIIDQALALLSPQLKKHQFSIEASLDENIPTLRLDRSKLLQAFLNLLLNAVDAMPEGGTLKVTSAVTRDQEALSLLEGAEDSSRRPESAVAAVIEDTGHGVPERGLRRIYEAFFSTRPPGKGLGLGLTATKRILELHGGAMEVRNRKEGGVTAILLLPLGNRHDRLGGTHHEEKANSDR